MSNKVTKRIANVDYLLQHVSALQDDAIGDMSDGAIHAFCRTVCRIEPGELQSCKSGLEKQLR